MEKLPTEVLEKILLPENFEWPAVFDETTALIDDLFDVNFFNTWRRSWVYLRVCRGFNEALKPILSAKFKRQAVALLMLLHDSPHRRLQVLHPPRDERETSDFKPFLKCWNLKDRQILSLIHSIHQTLDEPKAVWPSSHGFPNLEMSLGEAESLIYLLWEERCRRHPQEAAYSTCVLKHTLSLKEIVSSRIHDRRPHEEGLLHYIGRLGQLNWYEKQMIQAAQHS